MTTDPLLDSDDETFADENTRLDYGSSRCSSSLPLQTLMSFPSFCQCYVCVSSVACGVKSLHLRGILRPMT